MSTGQRMKARRKELGYLQSILLTISIFHLRQFIDTKTETLIRSLVIYLNLSPLFCKQPQPI